MSAWIRLPYMLKTKQAYQAMHLLAEYHIPTRTLPDEFNGNGGSKRLLSMDSDVMWPLYVRRKHLTQAIAILAEEQLLPMQANPSTQ